LLAILKFTDFLSKPLIEPGSEGFWARVKIPFRRINMELDWEKVLAAYAPADFGGLIANPDPGQVLSRRSGPIGRV